MVYASVVFVSTLSKVLLFCVPLANGVVFYVRAAGIAADGVDRFFPLYIRAVGALARVLGSVHPPPLSSLATFVVAWAALLDVQGVVVSALASALTFAVDGFSC